MNGTGIGTLNGNSLLCRPLQNPAMYNGSHVPITDSLRRDREFHRGRGLSAPICTSSHAHNIQGNGGYLLSRDHYQPARTHNTQRQGEYPLSQNTYETFEHGGHSWTYTTRCDGETYSRHWRRNVGVSADGLSDTLEAQLRSAGQAPFADYNYQPQEPSYSPYNPSYHGTFQPQFGYGRSQVQSSGERSRGFEGNQRVHPISRMYHYSTWPTPAELNVGNGYQAPQEYRPFTPRPLPNHSAMLVSQSRDCGSINGASMDYNAALGGDVRLTAGSAYQTPRASEYRPVGHQLPPIRSVVPVPEPLASGSMNGAPMERNGGLGADVRHQNYNASRGSEYHPVGPQLDLPYRLAMPPPPIPSTSGSMNGVPTEGNGGLGADVRPIAGSFSQTAGVSEYRPVSPKLNLPFRPAVQPPMPSASGSMTSANPRREAYQLPSRPMKNWEQNPEEQLLPNYDG